MKPRALSFERKLHILRRRSPRNKPSNAEWWRFERPPLPTALFDEEILFKDWASQQHRGIAGGPEEFALLVRENAVSDYVCANFEILIAVSQTGSPKMATHVWPNWGPTGDDGTGAPFSCFSQTNGEVRCPCPSGLPTHKICWIAFVVDKWMQNSTVDC